VRLGIPLDRPCRTEQRDLSGILAGCVSPLAYQEVQFATTVGKGASDPDPWTAHLITLLGVSLGALESFVSTRLPDRNRWEREESLRWDTKRQRQAARPFC
jgi:hypothetical protein